MNETQTTPTEETLNQAEHVALTILEEAILENPKNITAQIPTERIPLIIQRINSLVQEQKSKYWPNPQTFAEINRNIRYLFKNGFKKPIITDVKILYLDQIMSQRHEEKSGLNLNVRTLTADILQQLLAKFKIIPSQEDRVTAATVEKALRTEKARQKIDQFKLLIRGLETLPPQSQALVLELLVKHLAGKNTFKVVVLHDQPITSFFSYGDDKESVGLEPDGGYIEPTPAWPKQTTHAEN